MARLFTSSFELGSPATFTPLVEDAACTIAGSGAATTIAIATTPTYVGTKSLQINVGNTVNKVWRFTYTGVVTRTYRCRVAVYVQAYDNSTIQNIVNLLETGGNVGVALSLNTSGQIVLSNASTNATLATGPVLTKGQWHVWELQWVPTSGASQGWLDGVSIGTGTTGTTAATAMALQLGVSNNVSTHAVANIFFDNVALNDDQGASQNGLCGTLNRVVLLLPASDSSTTGFTAGAGGTTNLFNAVKNTPPVGVVLASGTNTSQIKDATSNTTDNYVALTQSYGAAGVLGPIVLIQGVVNHGNSSVTSRTYGINVTANPAGGVEVTGATGTTAAGTYPTGWTTLKTAPIYAPTLTQSSGAGLTFRKGTASTDSAMADFMGLYVEYTPVPPPLPPPLSFVPMIAAACF